MLAKKKKQLKAIMIMVHNICDIKKLVSYHRRSTTAWYISTMQNSDKL